MEATSKKDELSRVRAKQIMDLRKNFIIAPPDFNSSPLEDGMRCCPWRILVCCILRNYSNGSVNSNVSSEELKSVAAEVLCRWDSPERLAEAKHFEVSMVTAKLWQGYRKARAIQDMSRRWLTDNWDTILDLPGINLLGIDAIRRLVLLSDQVPVVGPKESSQVVQRP